jgi:hypothetical protein
MRKVNVLLLLICLLLFSLNPAVADTYVFNTVEVPGTYWTLLGGNNNLNQSVGQYSIGNINTFLVDGGNISTIDYNVSLIQAYPKDINDRGEIVGSYLDGMNNSHESGFLFSGGTFQKIDVPGSNYTNSTGINNSGMIVGQYQVGNDIQGYQYENGNYTTLTGSITHFLISKPVLELNALFCNDQKRDHRCHCKGRNGCEA